MRCTRSACMFFLERKSREVAGARADATQGVLRYTLRGESAQKLVVVPLVVGDSQVLEARSNGARKQLSEVKVLCVAGHG